MASKESVYRTFIQVMPSMDGFFDAIDVELKKQGKRFAMLGNDMAKGVGKTLSAEVTKQFQQATKGMASPIKGMTGTINKGLFGAFKGSEATNAGRTGGVKLITGMSQAITGGGSLIKKGLSNTLDNLGFGDAGKRGGYSFAFSFANMAKFMIKRAAIGATLLAATAIPAQVVGGGLSRALGIETAQAQLKGLGYSAKSVKEISGNALKAVEGTIYSLDQSIKVASSATAAGVKEGQPLVDYLSSVADAATIAGADMGEMGFIYNKILSNGKAWAQELNMMADRGVPIYQWLADSYGVSQEALRKMVTNGEVDAKRFFDVMKDKIGGAALASSDTTVGAFANMRTAMSRFGAVLQTGALGPAKTLFLTITKLTDALAVALTPAVEAFYAKFSPKALDGISKFQEKTLAFINTAKDSKFIVAFGDALEKINVTGKELFSIFKSVSPLANLIEVLKSQTLADTGVSIFDSILNSLIKVAPFIATGIKVIADNIAKLIPVIIPIVDKFVEKFDGFANKISSTIPTIKGFVDNIINVFKNLSPSLGLMLPVLTKIGQVVGTVVAAGFLVLMYAIHNLGPVIQTLLTALYAILPVIKDLIPVIAILAITGLQTLGSILTTLMPLITGLSKFISENTQLVIGAGIAYITILGAIKIWGISVAIVNGVMALNNAIIAINTARTYGLVGATYAFAAGSKLASAATFIHNAVTAISNGFLKTSILLYTVVTQKIIGNTISWIANTAAMVKNKIVNNAILIDLVRTTAWVWAQRTAILSLALGWIANTAAMIGSKAVMLASAAVMGIMTAAQWAWNIAMSANPIGLIILAVAALIAGIVYLATQTTFFQTIWSGLVTGVAATGKWLGDVFANIGKGLGTFFQGVGNFISNILKGVYNYVTGIINGLINGINYVIKAINSIKLPVPEWARGMLGGAKTIGFNIQQLGTIPALATGANIMGPTVALVGEKRPETVTDLGTTNDFISSTLELVKKQNANKGTGEVPVNIYLTVPANSDGPAIARMVAKEVRNNARR